MNLNEVPILDFADPMVYKNPDQDELSSLIRKGIVNIGVVSPNDIYYWGSDYTEKDIEEKYHGLKFNLYLIADKHGDDVISVEIPEYENVADEKKDLYRASRKNIEDTFKKIKVYGRDNRLKNISRVEFNESVKCGFLKSLRENLHAKD
jgi:hypothetical protein